MNKAAQLSEKLNQLELAEGASLIEASHENALVSGGNEDVLCIMHDDGSVNIIEFMGNGGVTVEVISSANILKVLQHYRPFKDVFKGNIQ